MVLTDCREQLDSYGLDTALQYLDNKLNENAIRRLLAENTMFVEVRLQPVAAPSQAPLLSRATRSSYHVSIPYCNL